MTKDILFLSVIFIAVLIYGQTTINAGAVQGMWDKAGSPYLVQGNSHISFVMVK